MTTQFTRRIALIIGLIFGLIAAGTLGYWLIEGWSLFDALYMSVITIGSVGYGEVRDLSLTGRMFTIVFIIVGVGSVAAAFTFLVETILSAELRGELRANKMKRQLSKLSDHIIICGFGRVGQNAANVLNQQNSRPIVVIDNDAKLCEDLQDSGTLALAGDATDDDILRQAGIDRAWGLIVASGEDSINLFIVVSARALNKDLTIVARSSRHENEEKMIRAGANRVVSPYGIGGKRMANSLMRPNLTEFIDGLTLSNGVEMWLEELGIVAGSSLIDRSVADLDLRRRTGVTLLAIIRGQEVLTPSAEITLQESDELILIGTRAQLDNLEKVFV